MGPPRIETCTTSKRSDVVGEFRGGSYSGLGVLIRRSVLHKAQGDRLTRGSCPGGALAHTISVYRKRGAGCVQCSGAARIGPSTPRRSSLILRRYAGAAVASGGRLIAHPDSSLVLRNTDMLRLPQFQAASARALNRTRRIAAFQNHVRCDRIRQATYRQSDARGRADRRRGCPARDRGVQ
jgi:hypothetical protein